MNPSMITAHAVKFNKARNNLLAVVAFTSINLLLIAFEINLSFLFSAFVPQVLQVIVHEFNNMLAGLVVGLLAASVYALCYVLSKRWGVFVLVALILFLIDALLMLGFIFLTGAFGDYIFNVIFHAWILYYLITGTMAWANLRHVTPGMLAAVQQEVAQAAQFQETNAALKLVSSAQANGGNTYANPKNIAIFASGNGSNFEAIATAAINGQISANISLLVCDKPEATVLARAKRLGVPTLILPPQCFPNRAAHEEQILTELKNANVEFIVLAGYMRIIGDTLLGAYGGKIVNIHPSLLPAFPGLDAIGKALASGASHTGVTVHYVDEGVDTGPIIAQRRVEILPGDTPETLEERVHEAEHELYVEVLRKLFAQQSTY